MIAEGDGRAGSPHPTLDDEGNLQVLIDMGAKIFSGGREERAVIGRKMTKRQMPVGSHSHVFYEIKGGG